jgi:hypothetical protein
MFSLVAWILRINSMWVPVVVTHGVGYAVRNTAIYITMPQPAISFLRRRITMMRIAVRLLQDSSKKTTVLEGIILIALSVGELFVIMIVTSNNKLIPLFHPLPYHIKA